MLTRIVFVLVALLLLIPPALSRAQAVPPPTTDTGTIACRVLEAHTDDELKVTVIVFHQRDEGQRAPLATLLREHSGEMVEVQAAGGAWRRARLVRLKTCFGRGLLMLPAPAPFSERAQFVLRLPGK